MEVFLLSEVYMYSRFVKEAKWTVIILEVDQGLCCIA